ncbi:MAG: hypothetical protein MZW92_30845 [Comamonadaceae bacterium]|nr:hypothetical protein [Comamonadaceae bacterium]
MKVFYWVMGVLIFGIVHTVGAVLLLYAVTGEDGCMRRASALWAFTRCRHCSASTR